MLLAGALTFSHLVMSVGAQSPAPTRPQGTTLQGAIGQIGSRDGRERITNLSGELTLWP